MSKLTPRLDSYHLLIVEDDADTRVLFVTMLEAAGAEVVAAPSAQAALAALQGFQPDAILCDIFLPETDGFALLEQIRTSEIAGWKHLPIMAITGLGSKGKDDWALAAGFQSCLTKPVEPDELVTAVDRLLQCPIVRAS